MSKEKKAMSNKQEKPTGAEDFQSSTSADPYDLMKPLNTSMEDNINRIKDILKGDQTVIYRRLGNKYSDSFQACLVFIYGMVDNEDINDNLVTPIMQTNLNEFPQDTFLERVMNTVINNIDVKRCLYMDTVLQSLFNGETLLLIDGYEQALIIRSKALLLRQISEPEFEKVMEGPREGFNEYLAVNLSLIRRKLKSPDLKFKFKQIGLRSRTNVCLCYMETLVNDKVLGELENRLDKINVDAVTGSNVIAENIKDAPLSVFATIGSTERPDVVVSKVLEGRIALIVDGTSKAIWLPFIFLEFFQSAEDYYTEYYFSSINRLLRIFSAVVTIATPAFYLAMLTFHQEMIPTTLLLSIYSARQGVPFPAVLEVLLLMLAFDLVREASARIPSPMGQSLSIVGALILGQAAVEAKFFSSLVVIIAALTGITGLMVPKLKGVFIIIRTLLILATTILGMYGFAFVAIALFIHLFSIRSLGVPYMTSVGSIKPEDIKDTFVRAPWWYMNARPKMFMGKESRRQSMDSRKGK